MKRSVQILLLMIGSGLFGGMVAGWTVWQQTRNIGTVSASRFVLVDDAGKRRAEMKLTSGKKVSVLVYDDNGLLESGFAIEGMHLEPLRSPY